MIHPRVWTHRTGSLSYIIITLGELVGAQPTLNIVLHPRARWLDLIAIVGKLGSLSRVVTYLHAMDFTMRFAECNFFTLISGPGNSVSRRLAAQFIEAW